MALTQPMAHAGAGARRAGGHAGLVEELDEQVRAVVRREGVDPQRDAGVVRRIAAEVVRAHDERSLTGRVVPVADPEAMVGEIVARVAGFGPLQALLDDPDVEEIWINSLSFSNLQVSGGLFGPSPRAVRSSLHCRCEQLPGRSSCLVFCGWPHV